MESRIVLKTGQYEKMFLQHMAASRRSVALNYFRTGLRILFTTFLETKTQLWKLMWAFLGCCIGSSGSLLHPPLSLGWLEIKWKLFFKTDGIALSLGCHALTNTVCRFLFFRIRSRNHSFLSTIVTCFIVFLNSFSWKPRSITFSHKISLFYR